MRARSASPSARCSFLLERGHPVSGASPGASGASLVTIHTVAQDQAIVASTEPQQQEVLFDVGGQHADLQRLVVAAFCNPRDARTLEQLQAALKNLKTAREVNTLFHSVAHDMLPHLWGLWPLRMGSFDKLSLQQLPHILEGNAARFGMSGLQCLMNVVVGSVGEQPALARQAFAWWLRLVQNAPTAGLPYQALPALLAIRLGQLLRRPGGPPEHALVLMKQLIDMARTNGSTQVWPPAVVAPVLIEAALVAMTEEFKRGGPFRVSFPSDVGLTWMEFDSTEVREVMDETVPSVDGQSLTAVAQVLAAGPLGTPNIATVQSALAFLANCPYPLIGCMAQALDTIQRIEISALPPIEALLDTCRLKRATSGLLPVESGGAAMV